MHSPSGVSFAVCQPQPMKQRCLPIHLIARNVCLVLALLAGSLLVMADIHAAANSPQPQTAALSRLFVYQFLANATQN